MTFDEFHNGLRLLRSIDLAELNFLGLWQAADQHGSHFSVGLDQWKCWERFRDNPADGFIRANDETAAIIWAAMQKRMGA